jgi:hypothetical protein
MSPDVISDANSGGPYAMQALIGILNGFVQNCFIVEFEDNRMQKKIFSHINEMPASNAKKKIMTLLGELKKRKHFICCLVPDYTIENISISSINDQAEDALLDFLFVGENEISQIGWKVETESLSRYLQSIFESKRSSLASNGRILQDSELDQNTFLDEVFKKAFIYTTRIEICDRIFGSNFNDNFKYTFSTLFTWLKKNLIEPDRFERIIIHCEKPEGYTDEYMKEKLALFKSEKWPNLKIEIRFYLRKESGPALPHDRFIITDQMAFNIGRGMDFLNRHTKRNRDISINYSKPEEILDSISKYRQWMLEPVVI